MNNPLVSIIVPCYNQAQYLDEALQSVLGQIYTNWECIIVDDGSTDNSAIVAKKWVEKNIQFKYYYRENGGLASARNFGVSKAEGFYILPLDADDKIEMTYLKKVVEVFEFDKEIKLVYCRASYFGAKEGEWILAPYSFPEILIDNMIFCSAVFKKEDFVNEGGYLEDLKFGLEDWDLWIRLLKITDKVFKIPEILFFYRKHHGTSMSDKFTDKEKHNQTLRVIYDNNRAIYDSCFGNPIYTARNLMHCRKKIEKIEKSKLYRFETKIKRVLKKIKAKVMMYK
jgi:glycosyltransferase involved in cell wall biosynthesis